VEDVSRRPVLRFLPALAYMGLIFFLSSRSSNELPQYSWMRFDKLLHTLEYGGLGFLLMFGLTRWVRHSVAALALAAALGLLYGVSDEFHQSFVSGRQGNDPGDMTADLIGATLGAIAFLVLTRLLRKKRSLDE